MWNTGRKKAAQLAKRHYKQCSPSINTGSWTKLRLELLCTFENIAVSVNKLGKTCEPLLKKGQKTKERT